MTCTAGVAIGGRSATALPDRGSPFAGFELLVPMQSEAIVRDVDEEEQPCA